MHNLLTIISASFLAIAILGMLVLLQRAAKYKQVLLGSFNLLLLTILSATTKGNVFVELSPAIEWLLFLSGAVWVALVYIGASIPDNLSKRMRETQRAN